MPGIIGIVSSAGANEHRHVLDRMVQPLLRAPRLTSSRYAGERGALAAVYLDDTGSPIAYRQTPGGHGRTWLAFFGQVFLHDDPSQDTSKRSMAAQLLDRYLTGGLKAVCGLNGTYSLAIFDEESGRLTLVRDRTGYSKLFYWHEGSRLMFASEYKAISWHPEFNKSIDPVCVSDIFLFRTPLEGRTLFCDIHSLPPAAILTFQDGTLNVQTYWEPNYCHANTPRRSDEEYAAEMAERMQVAIRRRLKPDTCLLVTGGLDSRILAGTYWQVAPDSGLVASTLGLETGQDVQVGGELCDTLGIPHHHIPIDSTYLARFAPTNVWKAEGKNGAYASWISAEEDFLRQAGLRYTMTGLFGNYISGRHYPREVLTAKTVEEGVRAVEGNLNPYINELRTIMRPSAFRTAATDSAATLGIMYRRTNTPSLITRGDVFNFYFRVCRHANTEDSLGDASIPLEPYLDTDVFDYAIGSIPPQARARALYNPLLVMRHLPKAAGVVNGNSGRLLSEEVSIQQTPFLSTFETYRHKVLRRLMPWKFGHSRRGSIPHAEAVSQGSRAFVAALLEQIHYYEDLFDPRAVKTMFADHLAGKGCYYMTIDAMVTFILWRKQFCELNGPLETATEAEAIAA